MAGYNGYSMSNNAVSAYGNGEKPFSKWTKNEIISEAEEEVGTEKIGLLKKLNSEEVKRFLTYSSWHHTSSKYNVTEFYTIDFDAIKNLTEKKVSDIISNRKKPEPERIFKITAEIEYVTREGNYARWKKSVKHKETVTYNSNEKTIKTANGNKRLSSLSHIKEIKKEIIE